MNIVKKKFMNNGRMVWIWFGYVCSRNNNKICEIRVGKPGTKDGGSTDKWTEGENIRACSVAEEMAMDIVGVGGRIRISRGIKVKIK